MSQALSGAQRARRVAARVVARFDLTPPVDVLALLKSVADVQEADWPMETVDAVALGLGRADTPTIFVRTNANEHRLRFTLAHELGHVMVPWHFGQRACSTSEADDFDLEVLDQEEEADTFASNVLLPAPWLERLVRQHGADMTALLGELSEARVSTAAALRTLRSTLMPGWIFEAYGGNQVYISQGTKVPKFDRRAIAKHAKAGAQQRGAATLNGYEVRWYGMAPPSGLPAVPQDVRSDTELLRTAIARRVSVPRDQQRALASLSGVAGNLNSRSAGRTADELFQTLKYKIATGTWAGLEQEPEVETWMARKAMQTAQR